MRQSQQIKILDEANLMYKNQENPFEHEYKSAEIYKESGSRFSFEPTPHFLKHAKEADKKSKRSKSKKKKAKQVTKEFVSSPVLS